MRVPNDEFFKAPIVNPRFISKNYPEFFKYLNQKYPDIKSISEKIYWWRNNIQKHPICYCGAPVRFDGILKGYRKFCSLKCSRNSQETQEKQKATCIQKYGVDNPRKNKDIITKAKLTCIQKYGVDNPSKSDTIKSKINQTFQERYGADWGGQVETIKEKIKQTCLQRYGVNSPTHLPQMKEGKILKNREQMIHRYSEIVDLPPGSSHSTSGIEMQIRLMLDELGISYITNDRTIIAPKELDIYIPELKIAIEVNGCYWHSDYIKHKKYHIQKFLDCRDHGIQLIQIWDDWMIRKSEIVKSMLRSKLGQCQQTFYARQCQVVELDYQTARAFMEQNHIQGKCSSNYRIGLVYDGMLVAVMCFNRRSALSGGKKIDDSVAELIRFCNLRDTRVIGGASKLLKYYINKFHPTSVVSFSANDISDGNLYRALGFESDLNVSGSYWYIEPRTFLRQHRSLYTRSGICKKWPEYDINDKSWTEREVMDSKGYMRIYDAGTTKWTLNLRV